VAKLDMHAIAIGGTETDDRITAIELPVIETTIETEKIILFILLFRFLF